MNRWFCVLLLSLSGCSNYENSPEKPKNYSSSNYAKNNKDFNETSSKDSLNSVPAENEKQLTKKYELQSKAIEQDIKDLENQIMIFEEDPFGPNDTLSAYNRCNGGKYLSLYLGILHLGIDQLLVKNNPQYQGILNIVSYIQDNSQLIQVGSEYERMSNEIAAIVEDEFPELSKDQIFAVEAGVFTALKSLNLVCSGQKLKASDILEFIVGVYDALPEKTKNKFGNIDFKYLNYLIEKV